MRHPFECNQNVNDHDLSLYQGSRHCKCKAGFYQVGSTCQPHHPNSLCSQNHGGCSAYAACTDNGNLFFNSVASFHLNGHTSAFNDCTNSEVRTILYSIENSTTGKHCSVAFISMVTLTFNLQTQKLEPPCTA